MQGLTQGDSDPWALRSEAAPGSTKERFTLTDTPLKDAPRRSGPRGLASGPRPNRPSAGSPQDAGGGGSRVWAFCEWAAIFLGMPVAIALLMPPRLLFPALAVFSLLGLALLALTPGFRFKSLWRGRLRLAPILAFGALAMAVTLAIIEWRYPGRAFALLMQSPMTMAMIFMLYPLLSALPQELIFRELWFRRYGALLPSGRAGLLLNAAAFSLAHLMYWNWTVLVLTFGAGLVFAWGWKRDGLPMAWALHSIGGLAIFAGGLGILFYSGNVVRPF